MTTEDITPPLTGWRSYEYFAGGHRYHQLEFDMAGGPEGRACVWADDSMWSIDTPEQPHSILFLVYYPIWNDCPPCNIRNAEIRFRLYGDNLALHGACCYFWVVTQSPKTTRWHLTGKPLPISTGSWGETVLLRLEDTPSLWHRSFASDPACAADLTAALSLCVSYGFAFVGFSEKVTGKIGLADFTVRTEGSPRWPYIYTSTTGNLSPWLTMSRRCQAVVAMGDSGQPRAWTAARRQLVVHDDYLVLMQPVPFAYLAFLHADAVGGRDLRNALLIVRQAATSFNPGGGKICFFVEHAATGTRWLLRIFFDPADTELYYEMLSVNPVFWVRMSGSLSLDEVLAGRKSDGGYDYFGFMLVEPRSEPGGFWGITRFSIGPTLDAGWAGSRDEK